MRNKCERCMNSRPIISENGFHPICTLSQKKASMCFVGIENHFKEDLSAIRDDEWFKECLEQEVFQWK